MYPLLMVLLFIITAVLHICKQNNKPLILIMETGLRIFWRCSITHRQKPIVRHLFPRQGFFLSCNTSTEYVCKQHFSLSNSHCAVLECCEQCIFMHLLITQILETVSNIETGSKQHCSLNLQIIKIYLRSFAGFA